MARIPTFADLGFGDPKGTTPLPQYAATDPAATAQVEAGQELSKLGATGFAIAADQKDKADKLGESMASLDLMNRFVPLHTQIATETNPEKIAELRQQYGTMLQTSANAIGDPARQQQWMASHARTILAAHADADKRLTGLDRERVKFGLIEQSETAARTAAASGDPRMMEAAAAQIRSLGRYGREYGAFDPGDEYNNNRRTQSQMTRGFAQTLIGQGRFGEVRSFLDKHEADLDPSFVAATRHKLDIEEKKSKVDSLYRQYQGGADKGYTGPQAGAGGTPGGVTSAGGKLNFHQLRGLAETVGFKGEPATIMAAIALAESSGNPNAKKEDKIENSYGLTQINANAHGPKAMEALGNPRRAMELAYDISKGGTDFRPWTMFKNNVYMKYMPKGGGGPQTSAAPTTPDTAGGARRLVQVAAGPATTMTDAVPDDTPEGARQKSLPPDTKYNSRGEAYSPELKTMSPEERANVEASMAAIRAGAKGTGPRGSFGAAASPAQTPPATAGAPTKPAQPPSATTTSAAAADDAARRSASPPSAQPASSTASEESARVASLRPGMYEPGNLDLGALPKVRDQGGAIGIENTVVVEIEGNYVLVPSVSHDGKRTLSDDEAADQFMATGKHFGIFDSQDSLEAYAQDPDGKKPTPAVGAPTPLTGPPAAPGGGGAPAEDTLVPPIAGRARTYNEGGTPVSAPAGKPSAGALPPHRDINAQLSELQARADRGEIDQDVANVVSSRLRTAYNNEQAATANERAALARQLDNGVAMLGDGLEFDADEAAVRHYFPKEKADEYMQRVADAREGGQLLIGMRMASPEQMAVQREQMARGMDDPKATNYERRSRMLKLFDQARIERHKMLIGPDADPAGYVAKYGSHVASFYEAVDPKEPMSFANYATATLAEQERLGVPPEGRSVLPKGRAAQIVSRVTNIDPAKEDPAKVMAGIAQSFGAGTTQDFWPQAFGDLVKAKLPGTYHVLATMDTPEQAVAAADLVTATRLMSEKGGMGNLRKAIDQSADTKQIDAGITTGLERFKASVGFSDGGERLYNQVYEAAQALAYSYSFRGKNESTAAQEAVDRIINDKYDFGTIGGTMVRVPKGKMAVVDRAAQTVQLGLNTDDLPPIKGNEQLTPEQRKQAWLSAIQNGSWVNNENDTGIVLMGLFRNGQRSAVRHADGSRVEVSFKNAPALAAAAPETALDAARRSARQIPQPQIRELPGIESKELLPRKALESLGNAVRGLIPESLVPKNNTLFGGEK
jgi:hypothetical protein